MIGIITALPEERSALVSKMLEVRRSCLGALDTYCGVLAGREVCLVEGGMGAGAAATAARLLIAGMNPALLMSAGYCGAVRPGPEAGDLVLCRRLFSADAEMVQELPLPGSEQVAGRLAAELQRHGLRSWQGSFITTQVVVSKAELAGRLLPDLPHPVLEMESSAVAAAAAEAGIPFVGLRAVSDDATEELRFSLEEICDKNGQVAVSRVLWLLVRRPWLLGHFLRLAGGSAKAGASLGRGVEALMPIL